MEYPAYVAALDIGGTKIAGALLRYEQIDAAPEVVFETQVPTQAQRGGGPVLVTVCDVANTVLTEARSRREQVLGIGVSTAEQGAKVGSYADGVIVGSALVHTLLADDNKTARDPKEGLKLLAAKSEELAEGIHNAR